MIRRIRITNWRAFENLDLELRKPVTFIVAPNGIGKTSLIEAVKWATFGKALSVDRGRAVRIGAQEARVELTIELPSGSKLELARSLSLSGKSTFRCLQDGKDISEPEYIRVLSSAWGADGDLLLALLFGEAGAQAQSAFPIKEHLAGVFGITPLHEGVATIDERLKVLGREIKSLRAEEGVDSASIQAAREDVQRLAADVQGVQQRVTESKTAAAELTLQERTAKAWVQYRADLESYSQQTAALIESLHSIVHVDDGDPETLLSQAEEMAMTELDRERAAVSEAQIRAASTRSALDLLAEETSVCPTCLRVISETERAEALRLHQAEHRAVDQSVGARKDVIAETEARLNQVREISRSLRSVRVPMLPEADDPGPEVIEKSTIAQAQLLEATEAHGAATARLSDADRKLEVLRQTAEENAALVAAYREETVLQITKQALTDVAAKYMTERIDPLAEQVSARWKLLFGSEGLRLEHDGSLRLMRGGEHLELSDLSGGERVVALFVARLLVVASATRATTLWLDEPLEHLDPRRRAAIARTIVRAVQQGALGQVVVTTFEERLARMLAATAPELVQVQHVRASSA